MISIKKDGEPFDLGDIQMTFRLRSPLWNDIPSHTFSFELDATDRNMRLTGYLHRPTSYRNQTTDVNVQCDIHGWMLGATLRVQSVTGKKIKCHLAIDNGQLNVDWGDKYIDEITYPVITRYGGISQLMAYNMDKTSSEVACQFPPIRVPLYFGSEEPDDALLYSLWINNYDPETGGYMAPFVELSQGKIHQYTVAVPQFYLRWVIDQIASVNGIKLSNQFLDENLRELLIFNNRCANTKKRQGFFRATKSNSQTFDRQRPIIFDNDYTFPNIDEQESYNTTTGEISVKNYGVHEYLISIEVTSGIGEFKYIIINGSALIINHGENLVKYTHFFSTSEIGTKFTCDVYSYDFDGENEIPRDITIAAGAYIVGRNASFSELPTLYEDGVLIPAQNLPNIKVKELLAWIKDGFGACHIYNAAARELKFVFLKDVINNPAVHDLGNLDTNTEYLPEEIQALSYRFEINADDAPNVASIVGFDYIGEYPRYGLLPIPDNNNKIAYVFTEGKYYVYTWNNTGGRYEWQAYSDYMNDYSVSNSDNEIVTKWHPPSNFFEGDIYGHTPLVGCKGSSNYFKIGENKPPLLLMLYYGMQLAQVTEGNSRLTFPLASGLCYDTDGNSIGNLELRWDGDKGIRKTYFLPVEEFYKSRWALKGRRQIDAVWLRQLQWEESYLHKGREYLLDSVEFTATQLGFTPATITAWRKP